MKDIYKVLLAGTRQNVEHDDYWESKDLCSSVTLLRRGEYNMLFDVGAFYMKDELLQELKKEGLKPEDITDVFITHSHIDHIGNVGLFSNANIVFGKRHLVDLDSGGAKIYKDEDFLMNKYGLTILETPGHCDVHYSYIFEVDDVRVCVAGDAFRVRSDGALCLPEYFSEDRLSLYKKSQLNIVKNSDVIVPGHGPILLDTTGL